MPFDGYKSADVQDIDVVSLKQGPPQSKALAVARRDCRILAFLALLGASGLGIIMLRVGYDEMKKPKILPYTSPAIQRALTEGNHVASSTPPVAFRAHEDFYYDAAGGLVRHSSGVDFDYVASEYDQNWYLFHDVAKSAQLISTSVTTGVLVTTRGTMTSGNQYNCSSNGFCVTVVGTPLTGNSVITYANTSVPVNELVIDGRRQVFPNGAWVTFDGSNKMTVWPNYYHTEPKIVWHAVRQTDYDAAGAALASRVAVHWYQGEGSASTPRDIYCHPGLVSDTPPPASLYERGTNT